MYLVAKCCFQALLNQRVKEEDEDKQKIIEENEVLQKQIDKLKQDLVIHSTLT